MNKGFAELGSRIKKNKYTADYAQTTPFSMPMGVKYSDMYVAFVYSASK